MAVIKLPTGRTIEVKDDGKKPAAGKEIKLPTGRTITPGATVNRINTKDISSLPDRVARNSLPKIPELPRANQPAAAAPSAVTKAQPPRAGVYGTGFGTTPSLPQNPYKGTSGSMPVYNGKIEAPKDKNTGTMYQLSAVRSGTAQTGENIFDAVRAKIIEETAKRGNDQKGDFVNPLEGLSFDKKLKDNAAQLGANLSTNMWAADDRTPGAMIRRWILDNYVITDELAKKNGFANEEELVEAIAQKLMRNSKWYEEAQQDFAKRDEGRTAGERAAATVAQGIGGMLPIMAAAAIPGGGTAAIAASGYGSGAMGALREGETLQDAQNRGTLMAGTGVATEAMFKGIPLLNGFIDAHPVLNRFGEGFEGVAELALEAPIRRATGDADAQDPALSDYIKTFLAETAVANAMNLPGDIASTVRRFNSNGDYYRADPGENESAARMAGQLDKVYGADKFEGKAVVGEQKAKSAQNSEETAAEAPETIATNKNTQAPASLRKAAEIAQRADEARAQETDAEAEEQAAGGQIEPEAEGTGKTNLPQTERRAAWDYADQLKKDMNIEMEDSQLRGEIEQLFSDFKNNGWTEENAGKLKALAKKLVSKSGGVLNVAASAPARSAKSYLRSIQIGITPSMKAEIESLYGNYNDFRKKHMGRLNLKLVQDGTHHTSIDQIYDQLHDMAPDWFPEKGADLDDKDLMAQIAWFVDQETNVYDRPFETDIEGAADWMAAQILQGYANNYRQEVPDFQKDAETHRKARDAQKELEAVEQQAKLSNEEKELVRDMMSGRLDPKMVQDPRIKAVYEARMKNAAAQRDARATKANRRQKYKTLAKRLIETVQDWKDKKIGFAYSTETAERNIRDIVPDEREADKIIEEIFNPVHENEAKATRLKNELREKLGKWKLGTKALYEVQPLNGERKKYSESALVQMFGEGKIDEHQVRASGANLDRIAGAAADFRKVYDDLLDMANEALIRNGYAPVEKRENYFPHFEEPEPAGIRKALSWLGINVREGSLPATIAGITDTFRPGKKYVANFQQRTGDRTDYDALKGFDRYIDSVADVIFHTDDIQRLRAFENEIRYEASDAGVKERVDNILDDPFMDEDAKTEAIRKIFEEDKTHMGGFVTWLRNYTDTLAGKKSFSDRDWEHKVGRGIYDVMSGLESRIAANMVGANVSSAFTNFIPIFQGLGEVKAKHMMQALRDVAAGTVKSDGFVERSDFLTNRKGTDRLFKTTGQLVSDIAGKPFQFVDGITSETLTRARYLQNIEDGMEADLAMQEADAWAASIMADRSKGALPLAFNEKNPIAKAFTMFQVEVNNQYRYMFKDLPRNMQEQGKTAIAGALFRMFLATGLYGELFEKLAGYDPTFNPLGMMKDLVTGLLDEEKKPYDVLAETGKTAVEQLPFVGNIAGGGRIPIGDALSTAVDIPAAAYKGVTGKTSGKKALNDIGKSAIDLASVTVLPFGGNQLKKTGQGIYALAKGRVSGMDKDGNETLQYLVEPTAGNIAKGIVAGKWSFPEAKEYVEGGFKAESAGNTEIILKSQEEAGISSRVTKNVVDNLKGKKAAEKRTYIYNQPGLSAEQKAWLEHELLASDKLKEKAELALTRGIPLKTFYWVAANGGTQDETERALNRAIGLDRKQKEWLWSILTGGAEKNNPYK